MSYIPSTLEGSATYAGNTSLGDIGQGEEEYVANYAKYSGDGGRLEPSES